MDSNSGAGFLLFYNIAEARVIRWVGGWVGGWVQVPPAKQRQSSGVERHVYCKCARRNKCNDLGLNGVCIASARGETTAIIWG